MTTNKDKGANVRNEITHHRKMEAIKGMYNDVVRGKQKWEVREKFEKGKYQNQTISYRQFCVYWNEMLNMFAEEFEENKKELKSKFISRYMYLYEKCMERNSYKEAREVLDSLRKLTGVDAPIEENVNLNGNIEIDFGFGTNKEEDED